MIWVAPSEKDTATETLEKRLWDAANQLWAGAGLKQSEYSEPVLGLITAAVDETVLVTRNFVYRLRALEKSDPCATK